jgi:hypothetical protein
MKVSRNELAVLSLGLGVSLLLLSSIVVGAGREPLQPSDFTPTAYVYLPRVARDPTNTPTPTPTVTPTPTSIPWKYERQCEYPDGGTVGSTIWRSRACNRLVLGQFGCTRTSPWPARSGYVRYARINMPRVDQLYLSLRYSKDSAASVAIQVYIDSEPTPRATFYPANQGDWNSFAWTEAIYLGRVGKGTHTIRFYTEGQQYGVADLDMFCLADYPPEGHGCTCD